MCTAGNFAAAAASSVCVACSVGTFSAAGAANCAACAAGKFASSAGQSACKLCGKGHYNSQMQRGGCTQCGGGKYQDTEGQTRCKNCAKGTAHNGWAKTHQNQCVHCLRGKFAEHAGSKICEKCAPNTHALSTKSTKCNTCPNYGKDPLRYHWTRNQAGWGKPCVTHPLNCQAKPKVKFGKCSKTCGTGIRSREVAVLNFAWGGGVACSAASTVTASEPQNIVSKWNPSIKTWSETQPCNTQSCPVDCKVSGWTWGQCTKSCGYGTMRKSRTVTKKPLYGGKRCPALYHIEACNKHGCKYGFCHESFIKCSVRKWKYNRRTSCNFGRVVHLRQKDCHKCDSALECKQKNSAGFTLHVEHLKKFSFIRSQFACKFDKSKGDKIKDCTCRCKTHPTGCFKKNYAFAHEALRGNTIGSVPHINACSTMCGHHPKCMFWEYNDASKRCVMKGATEVPKYVIQPHSYAGKKPSKGGCVASEMFDYWTKSCSPGMYFAKQGVMSFGKLVKECTPCPAGKYNPVAGRDYCMTEPVRHPGMSLQSWFAKFRAY